MLSYAVSHIGGEGLGKFEIAFFILRKMTTAFLAISMASIPSVTSRGVEIIPFARSGGHQSPSPMARSPRSSLRELRYSRYFVSGNGIFGRRCFTRVGHNVVGNEGQSLIPGGTVAPVESPSRPLNYTEGGRPPFGQGKGCAART